MRRLHLIIIIAFCAMTVTAQKTKQIRILHTSDTHSCILPLNPNLNDTVVAGRGGYLRRIAMLQEERAKDPNLLYFDSGDYSQGSPYYTIFKGEVETELMNRMKVDAVTIGNHEFDFGLENMARIFRMSKFPIVCTNYDFTGTVVEGLVKPWVIFKRNGVKVGVFGLAPQIEGLVDKNKCVGVKYLDPAQVANETAAFLKNKKKCDVVVCISHLGWSIDGADDNYTIANCRNVDIVLGGHSHTYLKELGYVRDLDGKLVPVDHNGKHAIFVGDITLSLSR